LFHVKHSLGCSHNCFAWNIASGSKLFHVKHCPDASLGIPCKPSGFRLEDDRATVLGVSLDRFAIEAGEPLDRAAPASLFSREDFND